MTIRQRIRAKTILVGLLLCFPAYGDQQTLESDLEKIRAKHDVCAMGALVIENGEIGPAVVTGVQGRGYDKKIAADARWHLGSCTKSMTATLAAVMVEGGDLQWDWIVGEAFADESFEVHDDYAAMTLVELLSHQAGVPNDLTERPMWGRLWIENDGTETDQRQTIVADYLPRGPVHPPKSKFLYSNAGYVIAGRMLEKRGGKSFEQLLVERVFAPLGMTTASFGPPTGDDDPRGHRNGLPMLTFRFADNPPGLSSAGRVHMTLADWAKYAVEHLRAARGEETKLLTPEVAKFLHTPVGESSYALGWGRPTVDWCDKPVLAHAGSNTMWRAEIWIAPPENFAVLVTVNEGTDAAKEAVRDAVSTLAAKYGHH